MSGVPSHAASYSSQAAQPLVPDLTRASVDLMTARKPLHQKRPHRQRQTPPDQILRPRLKAVGPAQAVRLHRRFAIQKHRHCQIAKLDRQRQIRLTPCS